MPAWDQRVESQLSSCVATLNKLFTHNCLEKATGNHITHLIIWWCKPCVRAENSSSSSSCNSLKLGHYVCPSIPAFITTKWLSRESIGWFYTCKYIHGYIVGLQPQASTKQHQWMYNYSLTAWILTVKRNAQAIWTLGSCSCSCNCTSVISAWTDVRYCIQ